MTTRTVGVEEEFLLYDAEKATLVDRGPDVVAAAERDGEDDAQFEKELKRAQAEHASSPDTSLEAVAAQLAEQRRELARTARRHGARLVASGTDPFGAPSTTTDNERYHEMEQQFAAVQRSELTCAMHVHVSVEDDGEAVAVLDRIAPWLSVLIALSANSPFHGGRDTGYATYRRVVWDQWPTAGPAGSFADPGAYRRLVDDLIGTGAARDAGMIYFDARLSAQYPTVEIRVCDVCTRVDDAITLAALCRALVATAAGGESRLEFRPEVLRGAGWRAARFGMSAELADLTRAAGDAPLAPAWDLADALVRHVGPALDAAGDTDRVRAGLAELGRRGTGAERQRAAAREGGLAAAVEAATVPAD